MPEGDRVVAVVVTFQRDDLLLGCLQALCDQTRPVAEVVVVDNAGSGETLRRLRESGVAKRMGVAYVRMHRNGGAAEGEHYGMAAALGRAPDWVWVMDDDCEPEPGALEALLASPRAAAPGTAALAPRAVSGDGATLPLDRGRIRPRWFLAPLTGVRPGEEAIDFSTFVGPLIRADAARAAGLPLREAFIRNEDVEYFARLREHGRSWLVADATIVHRAARPFTDDSLRGRAAEYLRPDPFPAQWKHMYALRNLVHAGRTHGFLSGPRAASYVTVQALRRLLFAQRRLRSAWLTLLFGVHGWRGVFRNLAPEDWEALAGTARPGALLRARALTYGEDVAQPPADVA